MLFATVVTSIRAWVTPLLLLLSCLTLPALAATPPKKTLLVYGDSLSAAYGLDIHEGWVSLMEKRLRKTYPQWQVINLSISGETTAGGLSRLPKALAQHNIDVMLLELGANDGLRGTPIPSFKANMEKMIQIAQANNVHIVLFEMRIPPNYGSVYTQRFNQVYQDLSQAYNIDVIPFFLRGVAGKEALNQEDGIHPTAQAQPIILDNIWSQLQTHLK